MFTGGCECKSIRYQFSGEPLTCYACHCTDCQTSSASGFLLSMVVKTQDIELVGSEPSIKIVDFNGIKVRRSYCKQCATTLWDVAIQYQNMMALVPNTFDDTSWFKPIAHIWVSSAPASITLTFDKATAKYQKQAKISELIELWSNRENS